MSLRLLVSLFTVLWPAPQVRIPGPGGVSAGAPSTPPVVINYVVASAAFSATAITTSAISMAGANAIVVVCGCPYTSPSAATDSSSNSYTQLFSDSYGAGYVVYNPTVTSSMTFTVTTGGGAGQAIGVIGIQIAGTPSTDVQANFTQFGGTSAQPGSMTPGTSGDMLLSIFGGIQPAGATQSVDSGYTVVDSGYFTSSGSPTCSSGSCYGVSIAWQVQSAAAAINPTWTVGNSADRMRSMQIAIK